MRAKILLLGALALNAASDATASTNYSITDLGIGNAYGLNELGEVAGQNAIGHAFKYSNGVMTDLGTLGGAASLALNIGSGGQVVGWTRNTGDATGQGFLFENGMMQGLSPTALSGGAQGINASGQITGWYSNFGTKPDGAALGPTQPFLYSNGIATDFGTFPSGSASYPLSINDSGLVVGYTYQIGLTGERPFIYSNGTTQIFDISGAYLMINAGGDAVGVRYFSNTVWHPILYSNGIFHDLGTLGGSTGQANAINTEGQIVGTTRTAGGLDRAFIYSDETMTDLNSLIDPNLGWTLRWASAINDNGQIAGWGTTANGKTHAFLLSPVPECNTLAQVSILSFYAIGRRRKRK